MADPGHDLDIPPAAEPRLLSPAREDYLAPVPWASLFWPVLWIVLAVGLYLGIARVGWHAWQGPPAEGHEAAPAGHS
ncbi:MAG: hypothetical protein ACC662_12090, partial [Planctomycetota bacterium]